MTGDGDDGIGGSDAAHHQAQRRRDEIADVPQRGIVGAGEGEDPSRQRAADGERARGNVRNVAQRLGRGEDLPGRLLADELLQPIEPWGRVEERSPHDRPLCAAFLMAQAPQRKRHHSALGLLGARLIRAARPASSSLREEPI